MKQSLNVDGKLCNESTPDCNTVFVADRFALSVSDQPAGTCGCKQWLILSTEPTRLKCEHHDYCRWGYFTSRVSGHSTAVKDATALDSNARGRAGIFNGDDWKTAFRLKLRNALKKSNAATADKSSS